MVICNNISKKYTGYSDFTAVSDVSLHIEKGEFVALTGKSGSGKSTLMNIIGLIDIPSEGSVYINGINTLDMTSSQLSSMRNKYIGYIFQSFYLEGAYTVAKNIEMPLLISNVSGKNRIKRIHECMEYVDIVSKENQRVDTLSGGEKQRVCIARALANSPEIILADEPCGNLDSENTKKVLELLKKMNKAGKTVIMVTHSSEDAAYADRIIELQDGKIKNET